MEEKRYLTVTQTAARGPISLYRLRLMQRAGTLPGFYSGSRYYVDTLRLDQQIDAECASRALAGVVYQDA